MALVGVPTSELPGRSFRDRVQATPERAELPVQRSWVQIEGRWIFTRQVTIADAPTIVLVHGLGMSALTYVPLMKRLAPYARVLAPDLPGFGRSSKPERALPLADLAQSLQRWVEVVEIEPDCFLGHSLGAQIVTELALSFPGAVRAEVAVGPTRDPGARTLSHQAWRMVKNLPYEPLGIVPLAVRDYLSATPDRMLQTMRDAMRKPTRARRARLQHPVLMIRGTRDALVPEDWAQELVSRMPRGELAEIDGAPHGTPFSHPGEVARLTLDFVERVRRDRASG